MKNGRQSIIFREKIYVQESASIVGRKEGDGPLGHYFDRMEEDELFGQNTWEEAESAMQEKVCQLLFQKSGENPENIDVILGGDLLRQGIATSAGVKPFDIPFWGLYGACSTIGEALSIGALCLETKDMERVIALTSSHFASVEKEFRFPLAYAGQRPLSAQWTVTGSGAFLLGKKKSPIRITGVTIGKIVDYGMRDSQNMGACMAPAAADTIAVHLKEWNRRGEDYDRIVTGDLGYVGQTILFDLMRQKGIDIIGQHLDCGMLIFDQKKQDTHAGGSGSGCASVVLASTILPRILTGEWKRVLFVPTGALLSTVSYNEGATVPGIAHAVVLEHEEEW